MTAFYLTAFMVLFVFLTVLVGLLKSQLECYRKIHKRCAAPKNSDADYKALIKCKEAITLNVILAGVYVFTIIDSFLQFISRI